jgi:hypothetical protein
MIDKIKTVWIVAIILGIVAVAGMFTGNVDLSYVSVGALAGWIGGNRNGQREESPTIPA